MDKENPDILQDDPTKLFSKHLPCIQPEIQLPADASISDLNEEDMILTEEEDLDDEKGEPQPEQSEKEKSKYEKKGIQIIKPSRVTKTEQWPYCAHGFIIARDLDNPKKYHKGSGVLIGANFVLTAGHVIRDKKNRDRDAFFFIPGATDDRFPFGKIPVRKAIVAKKYVRGEGEITTREYDYGLLVLSVPIGNSTGWLGLAIAKDIVMKSPIFTAGYPGFRCKKNHYEMVTGTGKILKQKSGSCTYTVTVVKGQSGSGCSVEMVGSKYYCVGVVTLSKGEVSKFNLITQSKYSEYLGWMKNFVYTVPLYKKIPEWVDGFKTLQEKWGKSLQKKASQNLLSQSVSLKYEVSHPKTFLLLQAIPLIKPKVLVLKNPSRDLIELLSVYFPKSITKLMVKGKMIAKALTELLHQASKAREKNTEEKEGKLIEVEKIALPLELLKRSSEKDEKKDEKKEKSAEKDKEANEEGEKNDNEPNDKDTENIQLLKKGIALAQCLPILPFNELIIYECKTLSDLDKSIIVSHIPSTYQEVYFDKEAAPIKPTALKIKDSKNIISMRYGNWSRLESLDLSNNDLDIQSIKILNHINLPTLKFLNLSNTKLSDDCLKELSKNIWFSLETLDISFNPVTTVGLMKLADQKWPSLRELNISHIELKKDSVHHIAQGGWNKLETLNLSASNFDDVTAIELAQQKWRKLISLNLSSIVLTTDLMTELIRADWFHQIETLDLRFCYLQKDAIKIFASRDYRSLTNLILDSNEIGDDGAEILATGEFSSLMELHLDGNGITAKGAKALSLGKWPLLSFLDLSNNKIGDDGVRDVVEHFYKSLRRLDLNSVGMTNVAAEIIGTQKWKRLSVLKINNNEVTDDVIKFFAKNEICDLEIKGNKLSDLTMKHLALRKMPQLLDFKK